MLSYSKALRGLSVQSRVASIFTRTTTSPDLQLRQCTSHYAIRAGQNLPDKEFRYLRTVIVTAAVYWGLSSHLRQRPVFLLNSCLCLFSATCFRRHPLSRSYGVNLPSSLTAILPSALGFSPHLPVSVCGTGTTSLSRCFSWKHGIRYFGPVGPSPSRLRIVGTDLPIPTP